ncbi:hypothetical protein ACJMK2_035402 [Sinanodonta woodiana]|uniref:Alpha-type protein kinase domain-containing protein n=1 Tax=Sinanodonta woodiana TaxID=1069815 RepID=A0ABD3WUU3_SINWO
MGNLLAINNTTFPTKEPFKYNYHYWTSFEPYAKWIGTQHKVFKGHAFHKRNYMTCTKVVVKTKINCHACPRHWESYMNCHQEAEILASEFNKRCHDISVKIAFITPSIASMDDISDFMKIYRVFKRSNKLLQEDEAVLLEERLLGDFKHFLSAKGQTFGEEYEELHAYSHFTYQMTNGQIVVSDLKGVVHDGVLRLTNPTIHSRDRRFGPKDDGEAGISRVCINHRCNKICQSIGLVPIGFG